MARVPYNRTEAPYQKQPGSRVDASGIRRGIAVNASANRDLANAAQNVINLGMALRQDKVEEDNFADRQRFESMATDAEIKMNSEIEAIPIADGVDYMEEAQSATDGYLSALREWVEAPGNVRHRQKQTEYSDLITGMEIKLKEKVAAGNMEYQKKRNVGAGKRGIETGIRLNQPEAIERGVMSLHLAKVRGYESADEAQMMYEKHVQSAKKIADNETLVAAENMLHEGNYDGFKEAVDSLELPSQEKKQAIKREKMATHSYNSALLTLDGLESLTDIKEFAENPEKFSSVKGMSENHKTTARLRANGRIRRIARAQSRNRESLARDASKGEFDAGLFDSMSVDDTENGLGVEDIEDFRKTLVESAQAWAEEENVKSIIKQVKTQEDYKEVADEIAAGLLVPEGFDVKGTLKDIEREDFHPAVKSELVAEVLRIADVQYQESDEYDANWLWGFGGREVTDEEKNTLIEYTEKWKELVEAAGVPDGLHKDYHDGVKMIRKAFEDESVDRNQIYQKVIRPLEDMVLRESLLNQMSK